MLDLEEEISKVAKIYILIMFILLISLESMWVFRYGVEGIVLSTVFVVAGITFETVKIQTSYTTSYNVLLSGGMLVNILATIFLNPFEASLVAILSIAVSSVRRLKRKEGVHRYYKYVFNISQIGLSTLITALISKSIARHLNWYVVYGVIAPSLYMVLNALFIAVGLSLDRKVSLLAMLKKNLQFLFPSILFIFPSVAVILIMYSFSGLLILPIAFSLLILALLGNYYRKLYEDSKIENMMVLVKSLEERDEYTYGHSRKVADLSERIARKLGLRESHIERIKVAALLHDIGKIGISDTVLKKPGKLSDEEFEEIKKHPVKGYEILKSLRRFRNKEALWVKYHHEMLDGSGYPEGLKGDQIPLESRIIAVADIYNALTSKRPYRDAMTKEEAIEEMKKMLGKIDPKVFEALLEVLEEEERDDT